MEGQEITQVASLIEQPEPVYLVGELARLVVRPGDTLVVRLKKKC